MIPLHTTMPWQTVGEQKALYRPDGTLLALVFPSPNSTQSWYYGLTVRGTKDGHKSSEVEAMVAAEQLIIKGGHR